MSELDFTDLPDLAVDTVGGAVILANDEFFAEKESLIRAHAPEWREHEYTDRGKWMDGWETRRRREPGFDWAIVRLGLPGAIRGFVVDTKWFRGNYPESCRIEACSLPGPLDRDQLDDAPWVELVPRAPLAGDSRNLFTVAAPSATRFTHVRLSIFPDGGVARLRVHGEPTADWPRLLALGGPIDLAAMENGAYVLAASDMFFGSRHNLIKPNRAVNMSDGWETRRRRRPGHEWSIVRLAARGTVDRVELDTSHFKGNAPGKAILEGTVAPHDARAEDLREWRPLLSTRVQPHARHLFDDELRRIGAVTHVRLSILPDGGLARLRIWGTPETEPDPGLARLNALPRDEAAAALRSCCASTRWVERMLEHRPFADRPTLLRTADRVWWPLAEEDWLEAFAAHPRIGERDGSRWSSEEQAGTAVAGRTVLDELAAGNRAYEEKFGFVYLIRATGRSAEEMLETQRERLQGTRAGELRTAAEEQANITRLRVRKWLKEHA